MRRVFIRDEIKTKSLEKIEVKRAARDIDEIKNPQDGQKSANPRYSSFTSVVDKDDLG